MGKRHAYTPNRCPNCGRNFVARHRGQRYCGKPCRYAHRHPNDKSAPAHQPPQEIGHPMDPIDEFQAGALVRAHRHGYVGRITRRVDEDLVRVEWINAKDNPALRKPTLEQVSTLWIDTPTDQLPPAPDPAQESNDTETARTAPGHLMVMRFTYRVQARVDRETADSLPEGFSLQPLPATASSVSVLADNRDVAAEKVKQAVGAPPRGQVFQLDLVSIEELGDGTPAQTPAPIGRA